MKIHNIFRFEIKGKGCGAAGRDRHKAPLPPGRCRDTPVFSWPEQVHKLKTAHMLTRFQSRQSDSDYEDKLWHSNMQVQQKEEELLRESSAQHATKMQLFDTECKLDDASRTLQDDKQTITALKQQLKAMQAELDTARTDKAGLRTALQAAQHTIAQQSEKLSQQEQQLVVQVNTISRIHSELGAHIMQATCPQVQQQQQQFLQDTHSHAGLFNGFSGFLHTSTAVSSLTGGLRTTMRPSRSPPIPHAPAQSEVPPTSPTAIPSAMPASDPPHLITPETDVMDSLKSTAFSLVEQTKQGVSKSWRKALAMGAGSGISIGRAFSTTRAARPSSSSGGSSGVMSQWGSSDLSMSAASSRRGSTSSTSH